MRDDLRISPRRQPRGDPRHRRLSQAAHATRSSSTPSTSSTAIAPIPSYALECLRAAAEGGADLLVPVRHQRRPPAATRSRRASTRCRPAVADADRHPLPQRLPSSPWPTALTAVRARRRAGAGHHQRLRRALRQRQPVLHHRQPAAQDGLPGGEPDADLRIACGICRASSTSSPTSSRTNASPTSASAPSRTRAEFTSPRCRRTRRPTSTSTRRWSATASGCWSPTSRAAPTFSTRRRSSASTVDSDEPGGALDRQPDQGARASRAISSKAAEASFELLMNKGLNGKMRAFSPDRLPGHRREAQRGRAAALRGDDHDRGSGRHGRAHRGAGQRPRQRPRHARCAKPCASSIRRSTR